MKRRREFPICSRTVPKDTEVYFPAPLIVFPSLVVWRQRGPICYLVGWTFTATLSQGYFMPKVRSSSRKPSFLSVLRLVTRFFWFVTNILGILQVCPSVIVYRLYVNWWMIHQRSKRETKEVSSTYSYTLSFSLFFPFQVKIFFSIFLFGRGNDIRRSKFLSKSNSILSTSPCIKSFPPTSVPLLRSYLKLYLRYFLR